MISMHQTRTRGLRGLGVAAVAALALLAGTPADAAECKRESGFKVYNMVIYFEVDSTEITAADQDQLTKRANQYRRNPSLSVCVLGQADLTGPQAYNKELAMRRATAVADYMKLQGLEGAKFQVVSRGQAVNDDTFIARLFSKGFSSDRRVEVLIMTP